MPGIARFLSMGSALGAFCFFLNKVHYTIRLVVFNTYHSKSQSFLIPEKLTNFVELQSDNNTIAIWTLETTSITLKPQSN